MQQRRFGPEQDILSVWRITGGISLCIHKVNWAFTTADLLYRLKLCGFSLLLRKNVACVVKRFASKGLFYSQRLSVSRGRLWRNVVRNSWLWFPLRSYPYIFSLYIDRDKVWRWVKFCAQGTIMYKLLAPPSFSANNFTEIESITWK